MSDNTDFFPLERNRYFYGKLLTVRDFEVEQQYTRKNLRLMNRLNTGPGVLCGLGVSASDDSTLLIESGAALDYAGRMVVLEEPALRKLQMLDGHEELLGKDTGWLCLTYDEKAQEPVNAVGADPGESRQFNMIRESSRLYLTAQPPEYRGLMEAMGRENATILYSSDEVTLVLTAPSAVCVGEEFIVEILVIRNEKTPPIHFLLHAESLIVESEDGLAHLNYQENGQEKRNVYTVRFPLKARQAGGTDAKLFSSGAELDIELGSHRYKNYIDPDLRVRVCGSHDELERWRADSDNLERNLRGCDTPIYLAKLELIQSTGSIFLSSVTSLPFDQRQKRDVVTAGGSDIKTVTASVRSLEYWQRPDVKAAYQHSSGSLHFDFGIPSPEQYDYAITHGTVLLTMPGGLRVNTRVWSDEIQHGLGPGAVDIRLSIEFNDSNRSETALFFGNTEVFRGKNSPVTPPWVEASAIVYPERGTMRIGLWLHDVVDGNNLTVHYFAQKPERDTSRLLSNRQLSLTVTPEFAHVSKRGKLHLEAQVVGSEDKTVLWSVKEDNGGAIDRNGLYTAPEQPGTYEIIATACADNSVTASVFVIVE